jgi:hypothetical protein
MAKAKKTKTKIGPGVHSKPPILLLGDTPAVLNPDKDGYVTVTEAVRAINDANVEGLEASECFHAIALTADTDSSIAALSSIKRQLEAIRLSIGDSGVAHVYTRPVRFVQCPQCSFVVRREALDAHIGSTLCKFGAELDKLREDGYVTTGNTYRTLEKAGVDIQWVPTRTDMHVNRQDEPVCGGLEYVRTAPLWAVQIASCTQVSHGLRVVVLEHCLEHKAARDALIAALKLGPGKTRAQRVDKDKDTPAKKRARKINAEKLTQIFTQALLHVGP